MFGTTGFHHPERDPEACRNCGGTGGHHLDSCLERVIELKESGHALHIYQDDDAAGAWEVWLNTIAQPDGNDGLCIDSDPSREHAIAAAALTLARCMKKLLLALGDSHTEIELQIKQLDDK